MHKHVLLAISMTALSALATAPLLAQGNGGGPTRALSAHARTGAALSGGNLARSGARVAGGTRVAGGLNKGGGANVSAAARLSRPGSGVARASGSASANANRPQANQDRQLAHRQQQADHLRANAERNGNDHLLETADRMDASATRNYERRSGTSSETPPPSDKTDVEVAAEGSAATNAGTQTTARATGRATAKGFWLRSR